MGKLGSPKFTQLIAVNKPLEAFLDINKAPNVLWDDVYEKGNILGHLSGAGNWKLVFPLSQVVSEVDKESVHFMCSPFSEKNFRTITLLTQDELLIPLKLATKFLSDTNRLVGFNNCEDDRSRKPANQSWCNFHFNFYAVPKKREPLTLTTHKLQEQVNDLAEFILSRAMRKFKAQERESIHHLGYSPRGAVICSCKNTTSKKLAYLIQSMDSTYRKAHENLFKILVQNYDEVAKGKWAIPYKPKLKKDVENKVKLKLGKKLFKSAMLLHARIKDEYEDSTKLAPKDKIFRSPTYVITMLKESDIIYTIFKANFFHPAGMLESVGIENIRKFSKKASLKRRKKRAETELKKLGVVL